MHTEHINTEYSAPSIIMRLKDITFLMKLEVLYIAITLLPAIETKRVLPIFMECQYFFVWENPYQKPITHLNDSNIPIKYSVLYCPIIAFETFDSKYRIFTCNYGIMK